MTNSQDLHKYAMLYVEDNVRFNPLVERLLEKGLRIYVAQSGKEAIQTAKRVKPDIILMNVFMPEMDGLETYQVLQSQPETQQIPVIFMSIMAPITDEALRQKLVGLDYVTLPKDLPKFWELLAVHLKLT
jgi:CheY-like chemotaxis protein